MNRMIKTNKSKSIENEEVIMGMTLTTAIMKIIIIIKDDNENQNW